MNGIVKVTLIVVLISSMAFITGCEWSSGGSGASFNTSGGAGININFSGVYRGAHSDGSLVKGGSQAPINTLVISQTGNSIEATDNNGTKYSGTVGAPNSIASSGTIQAGIEVAAAQMTMKGNNGRPISFVGSVHAVTVSDIKGETVTRTLDESLTEQNTTSTSDNNNTMTTQTEDDGQSITIIETTTTQQGNTTIIETVTITKNKTTGEVIDITTDRQVLNSSNAITDDLTQTITSTEYMLTEANTQYRLEGVWLEEGGSQATVDGIARPAGASMISVSGGGGEGG